jgi:hypothetical protein
MGGTPRSAPRGKAFISAEDRRGAIELPSTSQQILEFEDFTRKLEAAKQLTRAAFQKISKQIFDNAFFHGDVTGTSNVVSIRDPRDSRRPLSIRGNSHRERGTFALSYCLDALLALMLPRVRRYFRPVAEFARRYSLSAFVEPIVLDEAHSITIFETHQDWLVALCEYYWRPDLADSFRNDFLRAFAGEWQQFVYKAELETSPQPAAATPDNPTREPKPAEVRQPAARGKILRSSTTKRRRRGSQPSKQSSRKTAHSTERKRKRKRKTKSPTAIDASRFRTSPQRKSAREVDPRNLLIATIKTTSGERDAEKIAVLMDAAIEKMTPDRAAKCAPLKKWEPFAPEARSWKEFLDHTGTHKKVRNYINKPKPLPSEITRKRT